MTAQRATTPLLAAFLVFCGVAGWHVALSWGVSPQAPLRAAGVDGGLIVHLGCGDGRRTASLGAGEGCLVHGLDTDPASIEKARRQIVDQGLYGKVTVDRLQGNRLPYVDNAVNLLLAFDVFDIPPREIFRVLAPRGVALLRNGNARPGGGQETNAKGVKGPKVELWGETWSKVVKPVPEEVDEWTHYLHGPDNNAVAHDTAVDAPRHMQWVAAPEWTRNHHRLCSISSVVTAKGKLFSIVDEATSANMNVPGRWKIVARDAYSGVTLWTKPIESWASHQTRFRSGPSQLARLLVTDGDRLYTPLGLNAPVSAIDARSGKTLNTYEATGGAEEIILAAGTLLVLKGEPVAEQAVGHPAFREAFRKPNQKTIVALNAESGELLWSWSEPGLNPLPETLAADGNRVYVQVAQGVACFDQQSGARLWAYVDRRLQPPTTKAAQKAKGDTKATAKKPGVKKSPKKKPGARKPVRQRATFGVHTLVVADGVVLCNLSGKLTAISADRGEKLWECEAGGGFHAPLDVFVIGGLVWQGLHTSDSIAPPPVRDFSEARDLQTGKVTATNSVFVDLQTAGHHHRCYREKATDRFIITGKRGIEMMDLVGENHSRNNWIRGACQYGILPANGLLYAPSHACGCYMESKLRGFWALAPKRGSEGEPRTARRKSQGGNPPAARLERGPAFGHFDDSPLPGEPDSAWPAYRHDPLRSGIASTVLPSALKPAWSTKVGTSLTQPVVAGGKVVLSDKDTNTVFALDESTGKVLWKHVASGRVDSPPTLFRGMVLFGCAGGRVTCLRMSDGALAWRLLAAPADRRAVAFDRLESVWPVHGSVLVLDGVVYASAGRSTWIDGGIALLALEPATGKVLVRKRFVSRHPKFQEGKDQAAAKYDYEIGQTLTDYRTYLAPDRSDSFSMAGGAVSDVLTSDGKNLFLHHVKFNTKWEKQEAMSRHLFSTSSLLDDAENHRSHWVLGTGDFSKVPVAYSWIVNRPGRWKPSIAVPTGVMMAFDDRALWAVRRQGDATGKYHLLKMENRPFSETQKPLPDFRDVPADEAKEPLWRHELPVRATAMLKSGDYLYLAVSPVEVPADDPHAAYEGRRGGSIWVCSEADGGKVAQCELNSPATWDGMAAAGGRLYLTTADGHVASFGE